MFHIRQSSRSLHVYLRHHISANDFLNIHQLSNEALGIRQHSNHVVKHIRTSSNNIGQPSNHAPNIGQPSNHASHIRQSYNRVPHTRQSSNHAPNIGQPSNHTPNSRQSSNRVPQTRQLCTQMDSLDFSANTLFSPTRKNACIEKLGRTQSLRSSKETPDTKKSAVLIPLVELDGSAAIVFTKRSSELRSHRGEVSFPGGKAELGDQSLVETACRETWEELGIPREQIEVWTQMQPLASRDKGAYTATPIVAKVTHFNLEKLKINESEVSEAFCVPISQLCDSRYYGYTQFRVKNKVGYSLPVYTGPPHVIWGLTAIMTFQLLKALVGNKNYKHSLRYQSPLQHHS